MSSFRLASFPIEQISDLAGVEGQLATAVGAMPFPIRLLLLSKSFNLERPLRRNLQHQLAMERLMAATQPLLEQMQQLLRGEPSADPGGALRALPTEVSVQLISRFAH